MNREDMHQDSTTLRRPRLEDLTPDWIAFTGSISPINYFASAAINAVDWYTARLGAVLNVNVGTLAGYQAWYM